MLVQTKQSRTPQIYTCPYGLWEAIYPILDGDHILGYLFVGPTIFPEHAAHLQGLYSLVLADAPEISPSALREGARSLVCHTHEEMAAIEHFLELLAAHLSANRLVSSSRQTLGYLIKQVSGVYAFQHDWPMWARFPTRGLGDDQWYLWVIPSGGTWKALVQPAFVLAAVGTAILARITRTSMLETMRLDHVRTARAKGLREKQVMRKHVLRNAMIPVITILGIDFGTMVGAAVLTETVFNLPGLGSQIVQSAKDLDMPVVIGLTMIVTFVYGLMSLLVDLSYAYLNPRVRLGDD
jgi:hypothetical protein